MYVMSIPYKLQVPMTTAQRDQMDRLRGSLSRAEFARLRMFGTLCDEMPPGLKRTHEAMSALNPASLGSVAKQDEPQAAIEEPAVPPQPIKQELRLTPNTKAGYEWIGKGAVRVWVGQYEFDLAGVEVERDTDGSTLLRFAERSLVRTIGGE
jgi:hypothetical protein